MSGSGLRHWPGDPERPALALHCMMGTAAMWAPVARELGGVVDLRAFDMPGHGRANRWVDEGVDYHTAVTRQAAAMIDRPIDLIGHSFGATVALRIAVAAPDAVRSLSLIESVVFAAIGGVAADPSSAIAQRYLEAGDWSGAARAFMRFWGGGGALTDDAALAHQAQILASVGGSIHGDAPGILRPGGLESIEAPVLLIAGGSSPGCMHRIHDTLAERLPDVGRAVVPGAGHMAPVTHPAEIAGLIAVNLDRAA